LLVRLLIHPHRKASKYLQRIKTPGANLPAEVSKVVMLGIGSALGLRFRISCCFR
jgi:hypothetical protein